jgi:acetyl-CoA carboxylase biotin carboxylase subunit
MISKLAAWGRTREEAIDRLRRALGEYEVGGIKTTLPFFREIVRDREFIEGRLDTGFIPRFNERRSRESTPESGKASQTEQDIALIAAAIHYARLQKEASSRPATSTSQSRWKMSGRTAALGIKSKPGSQRKKSE